MKKRLTIILTAVILIGMGVATASLQALANSNIEINSTGSLTLEGGDVLFDAEDIEDMKAQVNALYDGLPEGAYASLKEGTLKNELNSKGIINYDSGKVIFDASDFIKLANGIDDLKTCYQSEVVKKLNSIHTYFKADGTVTHAEADAIPSDDASNLTFGQICNGILKSQSLEHLAGENILPASADNLSEGSAAWVDGDIVIGTGKDNKASYEQGYEKGYEDGEAADSGGNCYYLGNITTITDDKFCCDVKERLPEVDYTKLTTDNFIICPVLVNENSARSNIHVPVAEDIALHCAISRQSLIVDGLDYNNETGRLLFDIPQISSFGLLDTMGGYVTQVETNVTVSIYLYTGDIIKP